MFQVFLPVFDDSEESTEDLPGEKPLPGGSEKILLIDDEQSILKEVARIATVMGRLRIEVVEVEHGDGS